MSRLRIEQVRDLRSDPDAKYHTNYKYTMWNKLQISSGTIHYTKSTLGFKFDDFVVREITIRNKTSSEIVAEIGGLWAAAVAIIALFFVKSGHLNKEGGEETYIFKYLPVKTRAAPMWRASRESPRVPRRLLTTRSEPLPRSCAEHSHASERRLRDRLWWSGQHGNPPLAFHLDEIRLRLASGHVQKTRHPPITIISSLEPVPSLCL